MFQLTDEQDKLVNDAVEFYRNSSEQTFQFTGAAGTGKSVVLHAIVQRLGLSMLDVAPMAYTGAAAIVMRLKGLINAKTIHSWIYEPKVVKDTNNIDTAMNRKKKKLIFILRKNIGDKKLILIDEASFVPMSIRKDIESFGIKIIVCGDLNQLPPVADNPAYLYNGEVHYLTKIMRQQEGNAIIYIAHEILQGHKLRIGWYGNVCIMPDDELTPSMLMTSDVVICGRNDTRDKFNDYIRSKMFHIDSKLPVHGDRMMCRKNNWQIDSDGINLANGLIGTVINYPDVSTFTGTTYQIDFSPDMFNGLFSNLECDYKYLMACRKEKDFIKKLPYTHGEKFEYAYAITTHISQGSQYKKGLYYKEYLNPRIERNLDYTAITRFSRSCWYIIQTRKYY